MNPKTLQASLGTLSMPKALCILGIAISALVLIVFGLDLVLKMPFNRGAQGHGHRIRDLLRDTRLSELDNASRADLTAESRLPRLSGLALRFRKQYPPGRFPHCVSSLRRPARFPFPVSAE